ncbi:MAG: hypothetical protein HYR55_06095 [Acidobacteria bacterium]|nr:hypothetical protein [Acidobacteriota bacterium]
MLFVWIAMQLNTISLSTSGDNLLVRTYDPQEQLAANIANIAPVVSNRFIAIPSDT